MDILVSLLSHQHEIYLQWSLIHVRDSEYE